jgi:heme-degrading monooxygenase HmoA
MYAQITRIRVPMNKMAELREVIETEYLPVVRGRPGFLAGYLLEQVDDADSGQLVLFWESQSAAENFTRTGLLQASLYGLSTEIPGIDLRREGFVVGAAAVRSAPEMAAV